jgi:hypothetical protein
MLEPTDYAHARLRHGMLAFAESATLVMSGHLQWSIVTVRSDSDGHVSVLATQPSDRYNQRLVAIVHNEQHALDCIIRSSATDSRSRACAVALFISQCLSTVTFGESLMFCSANSIQTDEIEALLVGSIESVRSGYPPFDQLVIFASALQSAGCCSSAIAA